MFVGDGDLDMREQDWRNDFEELKSRYDDLGIIGKGAYG